MWFFNLFRKKNKPMGYCLSCKHKRILRGAIDFRNIKGDWMSKGLCRYCDSFMVSFDSVYPHNDRDKSKEIFELCVTCKQKTTWINVKHDFKEGTEMSTGRCIVCNNIESVVYGGSKYV